MKNIKNTGIYVVIIVLVLLVLCANLSLHAEGNTGSELNDINDKEGIQAGKELDYIKSMQTAAENDRFEMKVDMSTAVFCVINRNTGRIWWSNPIDRDSDASAKAMFKMNLSSQIIFTCLDLGYNQMYNKSSFAASVRNDAVSIEMVPDGFKAIYDFPNEKITIAMYVKLGKDYIDVKIPMDELVDGETNRVYRFSILPYFGAGNKTAEGYIVIPDGCGALINYNNGKAAYDDYFGEVYGRDPIMSNLIKPVYRENILMPVFGFRNNEEAVLGVITEGDAIASITANISGKYTSYNTVYPSFDIRTSDTYIIGEGYAAKETTMYEKGRPRLESCSVRYYFLQEKQSDYAGMARRYGDHLVEECGLKQSSDTDRTVVLDLLGALDKSLVA